MPAQSHTAAPGLQHNRLDYSYLPIRITLANLWGYSLRAFFLFVSVVILLRCRIQINVTLQVSTNYVFLVIFICLQKVTFRELATSTYLITTVQ